MDNGKLETFFVYKSLHSDESWGAELACSEIFKLPNICFGTTVYANNKKEAIFKAKEIYDKAHKFDEDKNNIREFMKEFINICFDGSSETLDESIKLAIDANYKFKLAIKKFKENKNEQ